MRLDVDAMQNLLVSLILLFSSVLQLGQNQSSSVQQAMTAAPDKAAERLAADTPETTVLGNAFVAPKDWSIRINGPATILTAPEGGSWVALVDVQAPGPDEALAAAWKAYKPDAKWPIKVTNDLSDQDGWSRRRVYEYRTSPNEKRGIAALVRFIESGQKVVGVPGVAFGVVQDGKVVFADGFGTKELGTSEKPDADTLFMVASNTKAMTTLLLAKLVDEHRLTWQTPVTTLLPSFRLGDTATTQSVLVKHLICACTGMPRQDLEWIFEYGNITPGSSLSLLGSMQPTSKFGELFQYSNLMAAAAGYTGAHVLYPQMDLGAAYDRAMQSYVFDPLQMNATTFDFKRALSGNHASPHSPDVDGKPAKALTAINDAVIPLRPAGGAWSGVHDMLKYVSMELAEGRLPDGKTYISKEPLLERRAPQV